MRIDRLLVKPVPVAVKLMPDAEMEPLYDGAKKMILDSLLKLNREKGVTVIITSSELAELRSVCNRIAIVAEGKISGILRSDDEDYKFGLLMSGVKPEEADKEAEQV